MLQSISNSGIVVMLFLAPILNSRPNSSFSKRLLVEENTFDVVTQNIVEPDNKKVLGSNNNPF